MAVVTVSESTLSDDSDRLAVQTNFPQLPAIEHPAVSVVVTFCGLATVQEALYHSKPVLCLPMMGDQVKAS